MCIYTYIYIHSVLNLIQYLYEINTAHGSVVRKHCVTNAIIYLYDSIMSRGCGAYGFCVGRLKEV